jgi:hypothetical protein
MIMAHLKCGAILVFSSDVGGQRHKVGKDQRGDPSTLGKSGNRVRG